MGGPPCPLAARASRAQGPAELGAGQVQPGRDGLFLWRISERGHFMDRMFALGSVRLALQSRPIGCSPDASPAPHAQVDSGVPGPACLDARWTLGRLVPSGLPTPLLTAVPPHGPVRPSSVTPQGRPHQRPSRRGGSVGLRDAARGREHCPRRNPVWPASQTSHPPFRAQGPGPFWRFFPP